MTKQAISPLITILGPTASGKTKLAVELAKHFHGEIISADSRQVYRGMDLGTGKDIHEYGTVPYHLIDIIEPSDEYNLFSFSKDFMAAFKRIQENGHLTFLVGGTGMYLDAVLSRYSLTIANIDKNTREALEKKSEEELLKSLVQSSPNLHNTTDFRDKTRLIRALEIQQAQINEGETLKWPDYRSLVLGIKLPKSDLEKKITNRLKARFEEGLIDEVIKLRSAGISDERIYNFGLEYRYILQYLQNELTYNDMFQKLNSAINKFTKQQNKWFRNLENKGVKIHWLESDQFMLSNANNLIEAFLDM